MASCKFCELGAGPDGFCVFHVREYGRCTLCKKVVRFHLDITANQPMRDSMICYECIAASNGRCDKCKLLIPRESQVHILRLPRLGANAQRVCDACFLNSQPLALFAPDERKRGVVIPLDAALKMRVKKKEPRKPLDLVVREFEGLTPAGRKLAKELAAKLGPSEPQLFLHFISNTYKVSVCKAVRVPNDCVVIVASESIWRDLFCSPSLRHFLDGSIGNVINIRLENNPELTPSGIPTYINAMWKEHDPPPTIDTRHDDPANKRFWLFPEDLSRILKFFETLPATHFIVKNEETSKTEYIDFAKISALIGGA